MLENSKDVDPQSREILQTLVWWAGAYNFSNVANLLLLTCSFHWCRWIFAKCSATKVGKTVELSIEKISALVYTFASGYAHLS